MSGITGILELGGRPLDTSLLERMTEALADRGPEQGRLWTSRGVGLAHRMLRTTPESFAERQPLSNDTGEVALALDGRVDNRSELASALETRGARLRDDTDAELVLRAYECWAEDCPRWIVGDFAFAIWDGRRRRLFCARDPLGVKPFYYFRAPETFLWASDLRALLAHPRVPREPNEGAIGEYLASSIASRDETLFRDIFRLPPGHVLVVEPERLVKRRYWNVDLTSEIRYGSDDQYAEHFSEILRQAVGCRLRSQGPVGAELSGGLDSSSVVAVARLLQRDGMISTPGFETFSLLFPGMACDEGAYIGDAVRMWNASSTTACPQEPEPTYYADQVSRYHYVPDYPNEVMLDPLRALAREKGVRVMLTGQGGDQWLTGSQYHYADMLRRLQFAELVRQIRCDSGMPDFAVGSGSVLKFGVWPLLPGIMRGVIKRALGRKPGDRVPVWIDPHFARRVNLAERLTEPTGAGPCRSHAVRAMSGALRSGWQAASLESTDRSAVRFGIEGRHPFYDRRLVEFAFALPEHQRWRREQPKFVLRQAMRGALPESIRLRATKADFSHVFPRALEARGGAMLFEDLTLADLGWVDAARVRQMYREMSRLYAAGDGAYTIHIWPLWMIFGVETWIDALFVTKRLTSGSCVAQVRGAGTSGAGYGTSARRATLAAG